MSSGLLSSITTNLSKRTSFFGQSLLTVIVFCIALFIILVLFLYVSFLTWRRSKPRRVYYGTTNPNIFSKKLCRNTTAAYSASSMDRRLLSHGDFEMNNEIFDRWSNQLGGSQNYRATDLESVARCPSRVSVDVRVGKEYELREIEEATNGLAYENVIGCGDYGVVYYGVLLDHTPVAVKKLVGNYSGEVEEFRVEVESLRCIRHKNLVKLLGYCIGGSYRLLVYEYMENESLQQWLHGYVGQVSPLTWNIRVNIIIGTAKGLAYLHEDSEPVIVHEHIKSSNILLDSQWNPKMSDFATAKLFSPGESNGMADPKGMSGYIAPEYAYTGTFDEKSDVYSFGILIMEIISGKPPMGCFGAEIEEYLIDWLKSMVTNQNFDQVVDPKMPDVPSLKELKRIILIALRCVDMYVENRPKMGDVIHMLEPRDLLLYDERAIKQMTSRRSSLKENPAVLQEGEVA
ncbi:hypothetical protein LguiB_003704 [Lonicera macranthoides]